MKQELRWLGLGTAAFIGLSVVGTAWYWISAPSRVVSKTLGTNNIITSYERFHDLSANFDSRVAQVRDIATQPVLTPEDRTDLNALRQSCREIAANYNADARKLNKAVFKDRNLPVLLDATLCEGATK